MVARLGSGTMLFPSFCQGLCSCGHFDGTEPADTDKARRLLYRRLFTVAFRE